MRKLSEGRGGSRSALRGAQIKALEVPAPGKTEQPHIVTRIQAAMTEIDAIENSSKAALEDINRLPRRVLAQAFDQSGEKMRDKKITPQHHATFEGMRQVDETGNEFWSTRDLAPLLEYQDWRNFLQVMDKARSACERSAQSVANHFGDVNKMVEIGSGAQRELPDVRLSRYACYLVVQNGDPSKPVIANGQTYFATQTRKQELVDERKFSQLSEDEKRLAIRNESAKQQEEK